MAGVGERRVAGVAAGFGERLVYLLICSIML